MQLRKLSDPAWANTRELERTRAALENLSSNLDLWFDYSRGLWKVMEQVERTGVWSYVMYWKGPNGEYRDPNSGFDDLLRKMAEADCARYGQVASEVMQHLEGRRGELTENKAAEREYIKRHVLDDYVSMGERLHDQSDFKRKGGSRHVLREAAAHVTGVQG